MTVEDGQIQASIAMDILKQSLNALLVATGERSGRPLTMLVKEKQADMLGAERRREPKTTQTRRPLIDAQRISFLQAAENHREARKPSKDQFAYQGTNLNRFKMLGKSQSAASLKRPVNFRDYYSSFTLRKYKNCSNSLLAPPKTLQANAFSKSSPSCVRSQTGLPSGL